MLPHSHPTDCFTENQGLPTPAEIMTFSDVQPDQLHTALDHGPEETDLVTQCSHAMSLLSHIQSAAIANMNHVLATDTRRIVALRAVIHGARLHSMNGLPGVAAQVQLHA